jgi:hypothetical protein
MDPPQNPNDELDPYFVLSKDPNPLNTEAEMSGTNGSALEPAVVATPSTTEGSSAIPFANNDSIPAIENSSKRASNSTEDLRFDASSDNASGSVALNASSMPPANIITTTVTVAKGRVDKKWSPTIASETHPDNDSKPAGLDSLKETTGKSTEKKHFTRPIATSRLSLTTTRKYCYYERD